MTLLSRCFYQNPVEHLRWSFLRKLLTGKLLTIVFIVFIKTIKKWLAAESRYVFLLKVHLRCLVGLWIRLRSLTVFSYVFFVDFDTNIFKRASEIWSQYLRPDAIITKKIIIIIICWNISPAIALWADTLIIFIAINPIPTFLRQFYPGDLAKFAGNIIIFFIAALIIRWLDQIVALSRCTWLLLLLRYFFINNCGIFFPLPPLLLPLQRFSAIFCCNKFMRVSFIETFAISWKIVLGSLLKISLQFNG